MKDGSKDAKLVTVKCSLCGEPIQCHNHVKTANVMHSQCAFEATQAVREKVQAGVPIHPRTDNPLERK